MARQQIIFDPTEIPDERWLPVLDYESLYYVSDLGRIRSAPNKTHKRWTLLQPEAIKGYLRVTLSRGMQIERRFVHQIVATAFVGPCPEGHTPNHKDGVKANNRSDNLDYQTPSGQMLHAARIGLTQTGAQHHWNRHPENRLTGDRNPLRQHPERAARGEDNGNAKLTNAERLAIVIEYLPGKVTQYDLARKYSVSQHAIWCVLHPHPRRP